MPRVVACAHVCILYLDTIEKIKWAVLGVERRREDLFDRLIELTPRPGSVPFLEVERHRYRYREWLLTNYTLIPLTEKKYTIIFTIRLHEQ